MKSNIEEKIEKILERENKLEQNFVGYIPEERITCWILAIKEFLPEIQDVSAQIESGGPGRNWRITVDCRLLLICFRATFRLSTTQLETVLLNDKNSRLFEFLQLFSNHAYISHAEWSNRSEIFEKYNSLIKELAAKIKRRYHEFILERHVQDYLTRCKNSKHQEIINVVELLEGINFTAYFPEELLEWNNVYPSDLMYKVFVFMKLRMIPSIPYLEYILNEKFGVAQELVPVIGTALGFYIRIPARDKLYKAHQTFHPAVMEKILENNAELLIKEGIANPEILIGDSTVCRTRKDDPNGVKFHARDSESARVMKFQAIVDPHCIPLGLIPRKGTEHDRKGFNSTKQKLVRLKSIAEKYGIPIKFVLLDSGYFSLEIMQFIEEKLGAIPIIDINPMNSKILKLLKERLEYFKQYLREIIRLGVKFPKLAKMCYLRFLEDIAQAERELDHLKGIKPGLVSACLRIFRKIGLEDFITLYRERPVIEGLFGMMKGCYALLGRADRRLPVKGEDQAYKHGLFILNAMQFLAYFNYRILNTKNHLLRSLYFIKFKEISVLF